MRWKQVERGWYRGYLDNSFEPFVAIVCEGPNRWCVVYRLVNMPPGDSQHRTLALAKAEVDRLVEKERQHGTD